MIYCKKLLGYIEQNEDCIKCDYYDKETNACNPDDSDNEGLEGFPKEHL